MLFKTEGIVLHVVRYRETSVIVKIFTTLFGIQSYIVNGVRSPKQKSGKANILQPAHIVDLVVYHREEKNLQRISEFKPAYIYRRLYGNIVKNTLALFMVELLHKCLTEPEANPDLYFFCRDTLTWMDQQPSSALSNLPLYFTLRVAGLLGFEISGRYEDKTSFLDLQEGAFVADLPKQFFLEGKKAEDTYRLLNLYEKSRLSEIKMTSKDREELLLTYLDFLRLHVPEFPGLRSPGILKRILHE